MRESINSACIYFVYKYKKKTECAKAKRIASVWNNFNKILEKFNKNEMSASNSTEGDLNSNETVAASAAAGQDEPVEQAEQVAGQPKNELLDMVFVLESEKQALIEESRKRIGALRKDFEVSFERSVF